MKKKYDLVIVAALISIAFLSGCLGGDENKEAWNEKVTTTNSYILQGKGSYEAFEEALDNEQYDIAYLNIDDAIEQYEDALDNLEDLRDVADEIDEYFLEDYLDAWEDNLNDLIDVSNYDKMLAIIMEYNYSRSNFFSQDSLGTQYINSAIDNYDNDLLQQSIADANTANDHYLSTKYHSERMSELGVLLGVAYITEYADLLAERSQYMLDICSNIVAAASYKESDVSMANQYVTTISSQLSASRGINDQISDFYELHPDLIEETDGIYLWSLYSNYMGLKNTAMISANMNKMEMDEIVDENEDFFE